MLKNHRKIIIHTALLIAGACHLIAAHAANAWDATNDFTAATTTNPNGVWSYGYNPASIDGYQFQVFDTFTTAEGVIPIWLDSTYNALNTPSFLKNVTSSPLNNGIEPGQISLHPGPVPNGDEAILRFTAPEISSYKVDAQFFFGDTGETDAWIVKNGDFASPLSTLGITSVNPAFSTVDLQLNAGDTIDFVVGNHGEFHFDSTPLSVQISSVPVPGAAWLFGSGAMALLASFKRRSIRAIV